MITRFAKAASFATLLGFCLCLTSSTQAQLDICVVDVAQVFKNHNGFNQQLETLKQEAEAFKFELQQKAQQLQAKGEQLKNLQPGSAEYKSLETEVAQTGANLEVERRSKSREFVTREARMHFDTYMQVSRIIAEYCEKNGVRLALRYDSTQMNIDDPNTIMQRVNGYVVYHKPQKDITQTIIQLVNQAAPAVGNRANPNVNR